MRILTWTVTVVVLIALAVGVTMYVSPGVVSSVTRDAPETAEPEDVWLDHLFSQNPSDAEAAATWVVQIGAEALPIIERTLQSAEEDRERKKAALKACGLLGPVAAPLMTEVARFLRQQDLAPDAAAALSFMGPDALAPLVDGLAHADPVVRRESLRSIGKLRERAPVEPDAVIPLLVGGMSDPDPTVRAIAATYLGIVRARAEESIAALAAGLGDPDPSVRLAAAAALYEFGVAAGPAAPALRKAAGDRDPEVAREAGRTLVNIGSVR